MQSLAMFSGCLAVRVIFAWNSGPFYTSRRLYFSLQLLGRMLASGRFPNAPTSSRASAFWAFKSSSHSDPGNSSPSVLRRSIP